MARNVVVSSDKSGEPGARTYTLRVEGDGEWEVDLTDKEGEAVLGTFKQYGREKTVGKTGGGPRGLEARVRNLPDKPKT